MTLEKTSIDTSPADEQGTQDEKPEKKNSALNIPGLLAGAATAATMSVIGGHLSVVGTVLGAALTSIVSGLAVVLYSTSFEKSRRGLKKVSTVVAERVLPRDGRSIPETHGSTADDGPGPRFRLPLKPFLVSTGVIIGLAFAAIFGIQALTGTELSGGTGTIQRSVTGSESVAVRSVTTPAPAGELAPGTDAVDPAEGADPAVAPTTAGDVVPGETAPTSGAVTGDGTTGDAAAGTGDQQLGGGQTGADTGQVDSGSAGQQGATGADAGAAPAAP
ncbi:hypothetical protein [Kocuria sabuli]|uniref:hypothetical protein n=1 Tax=Kocuria sabuli TaxID=3071448 RepID=UPI0034D76BF4